MDSNELLRRAGSSPPAAMPCAVESGRQDAAGFHRFRESLLPGQDGFKTAARS